MHYYSHAILPKINACRCVNIIVFALHKSFILSYYVWLMMIHCVFFLFYVALSSHITSHHIHDNTSVLFGKYNFQIDSWAVLVKKKLHINRYWCWYGYRWKFNSKLQQSQNWRGREKPKYIFRWRFHFVLSRRKEMFRFRFSISFPFLNWYKTIGTYVKNKTIFNAYRWDMTSIIEMIFSEERKKRRKKMRRNIADGKACETIVNTNMNMNTNQWT